MLCFHHKTANDVYHAVHDIVHDCIFNPDAPKFDHPGFTTGCLDPYTEINTGKSYEWS